MARGAWTKVAWSAACVVNATRLGGDAIQPRDLDPYGLLQDDVQPEDDGRIPYDPKILEAIQNSGKFR